MAPLLDGHADFPKLPSRTLSAAMPLPDLVALAASLEAVMREAGVIAADFFRRGARRWEKAGFQIGRCNQGL